jgi:hypothetical protein
LCAPAEKSAVAFALASKLAKLAENLCASGALKVGAWRIQTKTTNCSDQILRSCFAPFVDVICFQLSGVPAPLGASTVLGCFVSEMLHYAYKILKPVLGLLANQGRKIEAQVLWRMNVWWHGSHVFSVSGARSMWTIERTSSRVLSARFSLT